MAAATYAKIDDFRRRQVNSMQELAPGQVERRKAWLAVEERDRVIYENEFLKKMSIQRIKGYEAALSTLAALHLDEQRNRKEEEDAAREEQEADRESLRRKLRIAEAERDELLKQMHVVEAAARQIGPTANQIATVASCAITEPVLLRRAVDIIEKHGPTVCLSTFSQKLYEADEHAKLAVSDEGGMMAWLQTSPSVFELHGAHSGGHERVSLRGSVERAPTEAELKARQLSVDPRPLGKGSDTVSSSATSNATVKQCVGEAAIRRPRTTGEDKRRLSAIVHVRDHDPHKHGTNPYIGEDRSPLKGEMLAELDKHRTRPAKAARRTSAALGVPRTKSGGTGTHSIKPAGGD